MATLPRSIAGAYAAPPRPDSLSIGWPKRILGPPELAGFREARSAAHGEPVQPGIEFQFNAAIVASGLTITVQDLTTLAYVTGTTSYNSGTRIASWVASPATPLVRGTKYLVTITGSRRPTAPRCPRRSR